VYLVYVMHALVAPLLYNTFSPNHQTLDF